VAKEQMVQKRSGRKEGICGWGRGTGARGKWRHGGGEAHFLEQRAACLGKAEYLSGNRRLVDGVRGKVCLWSVIPRRESVRVLLGGPYRAVLARGRARLANEGGRKDGLRRGGEEEGPPQRYSITTSSIRRSRTLGIGKRCQCGMRPVTTGARRRASLPRRKRKQREILGDNKGRGSR